MYFTENFTNVCTLFVPSRIGVVCPREGRAGVTHAISPISFKLKQFARVTKLFKNPK